MKTHLIFSCLFIVSTIFVASVEYSACAPMGTIDEEALYSTASEAGSCFQRYTQNVSKVGLQTGLKAAANRFLRRGLVLNNTTPFARIDLRRFEPVWRPTFETFWVLSCSL